VSEAGAWTEADTEAGSLEVPFDIPYFRSAWAYLWFSHSCSRHMCNRMDFFAP